MAPNSSKEACPIISSTRAGVKLTVAKSPLCAALCSGVSASAEDRGGCEQGGLHAWPLMKDRIAK